ncbi:MAG: hypothetical protein CML07_01275 [Psychrobacter sp.]|jgi:DNA-binding Lrp family transcriptional regulator|nr:hypothetical protein [Psychrobacter sp.]
MDGKLTVTELAKRLGVTSQAIHNRIRRGTLQATKLDGTWYVEPEEAERVLNIARPIENESDTSVENGVDKPCETCKRWEEKYALIVGQDEYLKKRMEWLEGQMERQTILFAQEQKQRLQALPKPFRFLRRLFHGT